MAKKKLKAPLPGEAIRPFSALQAQKLRPAENDQLREEIANKLALLTSGFRVEQLRVGCGSEACKLTR